ncbi:hypothetical protein K2X40_01635 [Candidatus Babeliales bacterium]|nr:hypothetical protein [Candidatus Babeliales bacterium]
MKTFYSKIVLLSIITLTAPTAHAKDMPTRLATTDRQIINNNLQIGKNDSDKTRRDLEVTREAFLRSNLIVGSGSNLDEQGNRNCGCNRTLGTFPFNPNTQLLCIEFCNNDSDSNGAWLNMTFCGKVAPRPEEAEEAQEEQEELEALIPISSTYTRLFVSSSDVTDSYLWANSTVIRDDQGNDNCPNGACISSFDFINDQYPYITNTQTESTKIYVGIYDNNQNDFAFYLQNTYDYLFTQGCLFVDQISCNIKNIKVVDIPQDFFSLSPILREKIVSVITGLEENHNVFQIFGVAQLIATYPELANLLTEFLLSEDEELIEEVCFFIELIWYYLYVAMII